MLLVLIFILPAAKAGIILKSYPDDKARLVDSSKLTIAIQALASIVLIAAVII